MSVLTYNPYENASQFDRVADIIRLDDATRQLLRQPMREYHFLIPVRMDDGSTKVFKGFRFSIMMPVVAKGGIRFHPHETADTVRLWRCG